MNFNRRLRSAGSDATQDEHSKARQAEICFRDKFDRQQNRQEYHIAIRQFGDQTKDILNQPILGLQRESIEKVPGEILNALPRPGRPFL